MPDEVLLVARQDTAYNRFHDLAYLAASEWGDHANFHQHTPGDGIAKLAHDQAARIFQYMLELAHQDIEQGYYRHHGVSRALHTQSIIAQVSPKGFWHIMEPRNLTTLTTVADLKDQTLTQVREL